VFVDGCFWHGCPTHFRPPSTNADYWLQKIERNRARDVDTDSRLRDAGWIVLRVWEHEHPDAAVRRVRAVMVARGTPPRYSRP
jgi:DNA mismatch endonuclease (patch repair protein)